MLTLGAYTVYVERPSIARYLSVCGLYALGLMSKQMLVTMPLVLLLSGLLADWDWFPGSTGGFKNGIRPPQSKSAEPREATVERCLSQFFNTLCGRGTVFGRLPARWRLISEKIPLLIAIGVTSCAIVLSNRSAMEAVNAVATITAKSMRAGQCGSCLRGLSGPIFLSRRISRLLSSSGQSHLPVPLGCLGSLGLLRSDHGGYHRVPASAALFVGWMALVSECLSRSVEWYKTRRSRPRRKPLYLFESDRFIDRAYSWRRCGGSIESRQSVDSRRAGGSGRIGACLRSDGRAGSGRLASNLLLAQNRRKLWTHAIACRRAECGGSPYALAMAYLQTEEPTKRLALKSAWRHGHRYSIDPAGSSPPVPCLSGRLFEEGRQDRQAATQYEQAARMLARGRDFITQYAEALASAGQTIEPLTSGATQFAWRKVRRWQACCGTTCCGFPHVSAWPKSLLAQGKAAEAVEECQELLKILPNAPDVTLTLGLALAAEVCKTDEANPALMRALELDPENADAHFRLGLLLLTSGGSRNTLVEHLRAVIRVEPDSFTTEECQSTAWLLATSPDPAVRDGGPCSRAGEREKTRHGCPTATCHSPSAALPPRWPKPRTSPRPSMQPSKRRRWPWPKAIKRVGRGDRRAEAGLYRQGLPYRLPASPPPNLARPAAD